MTLGRVKPGGGLTDGDARSGLVHAQVGDPATTTVVDDAGPGDLIEIDQVDSTPREQVPSALEDPTGEGLPQPTVDTRRIISGGPPPDGLPPIDRPLFHRTADVEFLSDREPVLAIEVDGDARAYPVQIMTWHEIVNDTIGGKPITVTYCPLCNSAVAYERRVGERTLDFGTSGQLYQSALVMYDRQTESLWSHFSAEAIAGILTSEELDRIPMATVAWSQWRDANPEGLVLSRETGHDRSYGRNPYPGYDDIDNAPFLFDGDTDGRLLAMTRVVGVQDGSDAVAVELESLLDIGVAHVELGDREIVVWAEAGTASALDAGSLADGRDVGTTGVFETLVEGQHLTFERSDGGFRDRQTRTTWNVFGQALDGPLAGQQLDRLVHVDTFWLAWAAFLPDTRIRTPA